MAYSTIGGSGTPLGRCRACSGMCGREWQALHRAKKRKWNRPRFEPTPIPRGPIVVIRAVVSDCPPQVECYRRGCWDPAVPGYRFCGRHLPEQQARQAVERRRLRREEQRRALAAACIMPAPRERIIRQAGNFLQEDLAQERALAKLEGRGFDKCDFYRRHAPYQERSWIPEWKL